jgi:hypothetical protein
MIPRSKALCALVPAGNAHTAKTGGWAESDPIADDKGLYITSLASYYTQHLIDEATCFSDCWAQIQDQARGPGGKLAYRAK